MERGSASEGGEPHSGTGLEAVGADLEAVLSDVRATVAELGTVLGQVRGDLAELTASFTRIDERVSRLPSPIEAIGFVLVMLALAGVIGLDTGAPAQPRAPTVAVEVTPR